MYKQKKRSTNPTSDKEILPSYSNKEQRQSLPSLLFTYQEKKLYIDNVEYLRKRIIPDVDMIHFDKWNNNSRKIILTIGNVIILIFT